MMKYITLLNGILLFGICSVEATPLGRVERGVIMTADNMPAFCIPRNAEAEFPIMRIVVDEAYAGKKSYFRLLIKEGAEPVVLRSGTCIKLGRDIDGYELEGDLKMADIKNDRAYTVMVDKVRNKKNPNTFYVADYCVSVQSDGSVKYINSGLESIAGGSAVCK
jgi:hypothetical protein